MNAARVSTLFGCRELPLAVDRYVAALDGLGLYLVHLAVPRLVKREPQSRAVAVQPLARAGGGSRLRADVVLNLCSDLRTVSVYVYAAGAVVRSLALSALAQVRNRSLALPAEPSRHARNARALWRRLVLASVVHPILRPLRHHLSRL